MSTTENILNSILTLGSSLTFSEIGGGGGGDMLSAGELKVVVVSWNDTLLVVGVSFLLF